jgi:hypothetical protein
MRLRMDLLERIRKPRLSGYVTADQIVGAGIRRRFGPERRSRCARADALDRRGRKR